MRKFAWKEHSVVPGFGLTLGFTLFYLSLIVLIPLSATFLRTADGLAGVLGSRGVAARGGVLQTHIRGITAGGAR